MLARLGIKCHLLRIWALSGLSWALSLVFSALSLLGLVLVCRVFYIRSKFWTDYTWVPSAFLRRSRFCFFVRSPTLSRSLSCVLVSTRVFCFLFGHIPLHEPRPLLIFVYFACVRPVFVLGMHPRCSVFRHIVCNLCHLCCNLALS